MAVTPLAARTPPQNLDAERSVLGGILLDNASLRDVAGIVEPPDFYVAKHQRVFAAMLSLNDRHEPIDRVTLKDELTQRGCFDAVGGDDFVDMLDKVVPSASSLAFYARIVAEKATARRLIEAAQAIAKDGFEQEGEPGEFLERSRARLQGLERRTASVLTTRSLEITMEAVRTDPPRRKYLLIDSNSGAGRMVAGCVGLLAAPGGSGKSWALMQLAISIATRATWFGANGWAPVEIGRCLYVAGEENADEMWRRLHFSARAQGVTSDEDLSLLKRNLTLVPMHGQACALTGADDGSGKLPLTAFFSELERMVVRAKEVGLPYTLIILDPLSRFAGGDVEKDNNTATQWVQGLERLSEASGGACVLVAHHQRKANLNDDPDSAGPIRGASGLVDGVRWAARLEQQKRKEGAADLLTLRIVKGNGIPPMFSPSVLVRDSTHEGALRIATPDEIDSHESVASMVRSKVQLIDNHRDRVLSVMTPGRAYSRNELAQVCGKKSLTLEAVTALLADGSLVPGPGPGRFPGVMKPGTASGTGSEKPSESGGSLSPGGFSPGDKDTTDGSATDDKGSHGPGNHMGGNHLRGEDR